ncbi:DNA uptake protein [Noviherbaspirillum cavernae]|uniref:DNA uptake protein n=2 Tax=Noviherbaspirillum cavernae TaxID=2320862 RepID=A0A418WYC3_9BURK|nr:helix-hairpin-helix domain-containing protein [Noviherbaspirillum cavernae]RJG05248.1 DNA uptake protein [Noviherbaspirillum cavernae]
MLKKLLLAVATMIATMGFAFAQVDVNKADQAALDGVKGIGPTTSKAILDERKKNGNFKDWADLENRVKGIGDKNSEKFSEAGLTVNGQNKPKSASAATAGKKEAKPAANGSKEVKPADTKEAKPADSKPAAGAGKDAKSSGTAKKDDTKK